MRGSGGGGGFWPDALPAFFLGPAAESRPDASAPSTSPRGVGCQWICIGVGMRRCLLLCAGRQIRRGLWFDGGFHR